MSADEHEPGETAFDAAFFAPKKAREPVRPLGPLESVRASKYAQAALRAELELLRAAPEGQRNKQLNGSAFNLAQLCAGGTLDKGATWAALEAQALSIGLTTAETRATMLSAFDAGEREPRVAGDPTPFAEPAPVTPLRPVDPFADEHADEPESEPAPDPDALLREQYPVLDWHELFEREDEQEWLIEPLLPARRLVALFSAPKVGKSLLMLELAVALARGTEVLGRKLGKKRRVLYVDFENDPRGDIRVRLEAMGMTQWQLEDLCVLSYPTLPHLDTVMGGLVLMQLVKLYDCEVVVIDTVSRAVGGDENSNDTWLGFYRNTGLLLKQAGVACIRLDHTGKDAEKGMRGGSAKYGDVDAVWSMTKVTETTFQLECTAHRLPIAEKKLLLHRETEPKLHHRVDTRSAGRVRFEELDRIIDALDELGAATSMSQANAILFLAEHDFDAAKHNVEFAVTLRKQRAAEAREAAKTEQTTLPFTKGDPA